MSEGTLGVLVLVGIATVVALITHASSVGYVSNSIFSGLSSSAIFIGFVIARGDADPQMGIAAVIGAIYATVIAFVVGLPFEIWRRSRCGRKEPNG